jgi:enoyl-CoA hydratase
VRKRLLVRRHFLRLVEFSTLFEHYFCSHLTDKALFSPLTTAGADIKEMAPLTFSSAYSNNFIAPWSHLANSIRTPVIAAVSGYALGGGCELALMCDIIYCTANATFGQPEIKLGIIPGAGGSQRLTRAVGKSKAMELILTGKNFSGKEAGEWGVAARVIDGGKDELLEEALKTAETIASYSRVAVVAAKEVVDKSQELSLKEGVEFERRLFHGLFGSRDQKIGELFSLIYSKLRC